MFTLRDHQTGDLFDPWESMGPKRRALLKSSWAGVFRDYLLEHLPVHEFSKSFRDQFGRPSKDLFAALVSLVLQQLHDLTDQQTCEAVAFNIAWHYALDIRHESDAFLCERSLRNYRQKILTLGLDSVLFRTLTDKLIENLGVDTSKQRLDSTTVRSAIRSLTRLGILVEGASKFLRELKRADANLFQQVDSEIIRKYVQRQGNGCFADTRPSQSKRRLLEAAGDIHALLIQFRVTNASTLESFILLQRIFDEQCEVDAENDSTVAIQPPRESDCSAVSNPADPDAHYNARRGVGFQVQIMETFQENVQATDDSDVTSKPDLITHVAVNSVTTHDQDALVPALDDTEQRQIKPIELLADSHYGSNECLALGHENEVEIVSPAMPARGKRQGKLTLEDFEVDEDGRLVQCPEGHPPLETSVSDIKLQATFDATICGNCHTKKTVMGQRPPVRPDASNTPTTVYVNGNADSITKAKNFANVTIGELESKRPCRD